VQQCHTLHGSAMLIYNKNQAINNIIKQLGNESVSLLLAQCWFQVLGICNAIFIITFLEKINRNNFVKQQSKTCYNMTLPNF